MTLTDAELLEELRQLPNPHKMLRGRAGGKRPKASERSSETQTIWLAPAQRGEIPTWRTEPTTAAARAALLLSAHHRGSRSIAPGQWKIEEHGEEGWLMAAAGKLLPVELPPGLPRGESLWMQLELLGCSLLEGNQPDLLELELVIWQRQAAQAPEVTWKEEALIEDTRGERTQIARRKEALFQEVGLRQAVLDDLWRPLRVREDHLSRDGLQFKLFTQVKNIEDGGTPQLPKLSEFDELLKARSSGRWMMGPTMQVNWAPWRGGKTLVVACPWVSGNPSKRVLSWIL